MVIKLLMTLVALFLVQKPFCQSESEATGSSAPSSLATPLPIVSLPFFAPPVLVSCERVLESLNLQVVACNRAQ